MILTMKLNIIMRSFLCMTTLLAISVSCKDDEVGMSKVEPDFSFTVNAANSKEIQFSNKSENATHYTWVFGDGETSMEENPVHEYEMPGTYTVVFMAKSREGSKVKTHEVTIIYPLASFTNDPDVSNYRMIHFDNLSENATTYAWDFGDGETSDDENPVHTYAANGTYNVSLTASSAGGSHTVSSQIVIGNLVRGGGMNAADASKWTVLNISNGVSSAFKDGKVVFTGGGWGHSGIYQAIAVEAGVDYKFNMDVSGSGASDTWFEVYMGTAAPTQGSDYSDGGNRLGLNTWTGCGKTAFNDKLLNIACEGSLRATSGVIQFAQTGTIYLVIRTGGANLGTAGIAADNIELKEVE
jgi:PKD repeat protein